MPTLRLRSTTYQRRKFLRSRKSLAFIAKGIKGTFKGKYHSIFYSNLFNEATKATLYMNSFAD